MKTTTVLVKQIHPKYDETQHFLLYSLDGLWEGVKEGVCQEPGHWAVQEGIVRFEVEDRGSHDDCTHWMLKHERHQDLLVLCQSAPRGEALMTADPGIMYLDDTGDYLSQAAQGSLGVAQVPLPATSLLLALGMAVLVRLLKKR
jgi:hypothetical protein